MGYVRSLLFSGLLTAMAAVLGGCDAGASRDKTPAAPPATGVEMGGSAAAETPAGLAELDETDRAAAARQRVCPVSGELLGSMGKPQKVVVQGQTVFLCCSGCEEELRKDPDKYLKKLAAAEMK